MRSSAKKITEKTEKKNERNAFQFTFESSYKVELSRCDVCLDAGKRPKRRKFYPLISDFGTGKMMRPFEEMMNLVQFFFSQGVNLVPCHRGRRMPRIRVD